jgi:ABC-2 type transport system permease protein
MNMKTIPTPPVVYKPSLADHLRLVWALASKDIADALQPKATLITIIMSLFMVLFYRYLPALTSSGDTLNVLLYAEEMESPLVTTLERSPAFAVYDYDSLERLMHVFPDATDVELAVVISDTAVAQQQAGDPVTIDGYLMYWVSDGQRAEIKALVEDDLSTQLGQPVTLKLVGHDVYFDAGTFFFALTATFALLFVTMMIGISVVPNLMVEEKQTKTLDALLVSPASPAHLVAGKALAGLFYGLLGSAIVLVVFRYLIIRWDLAILAAVLATLLMVAIGLLLGSYVKVRTQLQLVAWLIILPLLIPVALVALEGLVPSGAIAVMNWIPTVLIAKIFRLSLTPNATFTHYGAALAVTLITTLALFALLVRAVGRADRG